jgi:hypothetical protein
MEWIKPKTISRYSPIKEFLLAGHKRNTEDPEE